MLLNNVKGAEILEANYNVIKKSVDASFPNFNVWSDIVDVKNEIEIVQVVIK
ncbi:MAG: hypothetical protein ACI8ZM_005503 [Crocinitomix sp.]